MGGGQSRAKGGPSQTASVPSEAAKGSIVAPLEIQPEPERQVEAPPLLELVPAAGAGEAEQQPAVQATGPSKEDVARPASPARPPSPRAILERTESVIEETPVMSMDDSGSPSAVARAARKEELLAKKRATEASVQAAELHLVRYPNDTEQEATLAALNLQLTQTERALQELDDGVMVCVDEVRA